LTLAVVGMSACLGGVVFAPVTGILIVFEMTHEFALVPALMIGALVSQAISRKLNRESFYDALLTQDGHQLEHVRPPRDLHGWRQLPVSAIANFKPVVLRELDPATLRKTLDEHPYQQFPVVESGKLAGVLTRKEAELALLQKRTPDLSPAAVCLREQTVAALQKMLIESDTLVVLILNRNDGDVIGLVTLHDLLRAESAIAQNAASDV
jgi:CIC family chloride channel protein